MFGQGRDRPGCTRFPRDNIGSTNEPSAHQGEVKQMNFDIAMHVASDVFSNSFADARRKFVEMSGASRAYPSAAAGPDGESLFTDVAYFGSEHAKNLLVLVSGTHGVEGYCGSAAQLAFLKGGFREQLHSSTAVIVIHALNSYGFAWDRRVTAEGIDLNRNFIDFSESLPVNRGYEELAENLVPKDITEEGERRADAAIEAYRAAHGDLSFQQARVGGQYARPGGLFYGGTEPSEARRILESIAADYGIFSRERVVIVDYHTGLGRYGYGELQCEQTAGIDGYERAMKIFGPSVTSPCLGTSSSVMIPGTQDAFWERSLGDRHTYVALEFGTYPSGRILRDDHWLYMYRTNEVNLELGRRIRSATRHHFYPQALDWKEMVVWRSHQVHRQAIQALAFGRG